ncbi:hypothetical protein BZG36_05431 [Bifiguratus adelaidae]|uniref:Uncharacterized protein n=1 Tax=Bifiguratus adelaidae TaxID=1938954 RepID=A0A261XU19_9FUNG|nr:hypothetical protein BZG36_05431 [Bifiguratus adelaidae]
MTVDSSSDEEGGTSAPFSGTYPQQGQAASYTSQTLSARQKCRQLVPNIAEMVVDNNMLTEERFRRMTMFREIVNETPEDVVVYTPPGEASWTV